jgi:hypothetical protein
MENVAPFDPECDQVIKLALNLKSRFSGHNMTVLISSQARENSRIVNKVGLTPIVVVGL